jgi:hypothetical protein
VPCVQLIVTGDLEQLALVNALSSVFPQAGSGARVDWRPAIKIEEPAKSRLRPIHQVDAPNGLMMKLAESLRTVNLPNPPGRPPPDLLLVIGDVELNNLYNERSLIEHLQAAVPLMLTKRSPREQASLTAALRDRCSYHLFRPMMEATFFGDPDALRRAGVGAAERPRRTQPDVEEFESDDPVWLPRCATENARKAAMGHDWWRHERHAKEYLIHLANRPGCLGYNERKRGADALSRLNFSAVVNTQPSPYLRALFDDLADWLGVPNPLGPTDPALPRPPTALCADPGRLLRNIPAASAAPSVP